MVNAEFFDALEQLEKEKGIPVDYMLDRVGQALITAYKRDNDGMTDNVYVEPDRDKKTIHMFVRKTVVKAEDLYEPYEEITLEEAAEYKNNPMVGDIIDIDIPTKSFGRIAAQTAKQVIIQGIREAERGMVTKQKLGFSVSIEQVAPTNYSAELWKRMVCQTMPDLFFLTENQPLDVYLNQNCILPLSALLEEYPGLKALFSEQQWASRTYYRRIYAVPARAVSMYQIGFLARADWMRELGARPEKITDLDALHDLLMQVRQRRPNAEGVLPDNGQVFPFPELDPLGDTFGILTEESGTTVVNWYAADAYSRLCRTMHQWYQEGLILRNASLRDEPATDRMRLGNSFGFFARLNRDSLDCYTRACGTELTAIPLGPTIQNSSIPVESWCLPVTNSHRREALALLELLYTDASCYDLFANGDGKEEQLHPWQNLYLNASGLMPETDEQPQWISPAYGFSFNNSAVAAKLDACRALKNSYHNGLICGYLDSEEALPEFLEKLEQAGIQEILQAKQSALDNWLNALH